MTSPLIQALDAVAPDYRKEVLSIPRKEIVTLVKLKDVFDFQDRITDSVVGIVEPSVRRSEIERSRRKRPERLDAYDLYLRALPIMATISAADGPAAAELLRAR